MQKLYTLLAQDEGQTMAEYGVVLTVITLGALTAFTLLAAASTGALTRVAGYFTYDCFTEARDSGGYPGSRYRVGTGNPGGAARR